MQQQIKHMMEAPVLFHEPDRMADLRAIKLLDTPPEERFDRLVRLARHVFNVPIAYIALVDTDRQWFKASCGLNETETPRNTSFCGHAIAGDQLLIVENAQLDPRFEHNPMVTGEPFINFYAGHPLRGPNGHNIGTFCLADRKPRRLSPQEIRLLRDLAAAAEHEVNMVDVIGLQQASLRTKAELEHVQERLNEELNEAADYVAAQLPNERRIGDVRIDSKYVPSSHLGGDMFGFHKVDDQHIAFYILDVAGHGVGASLLATSVYHSLHGMTLKQTDYLCPASVLQQLNRAFPMEQHQNRFFSIWYGVFNLHRRRLRHATGGHHAAILIQRTANLPMLLGQPSLLIGVRSDVDYQTLQIDVESGSRLYLFSDGVFEARNGQNHAFGFQAVGKLLYQLRDRPDNRLEAVWDAVDQFSGGGPLNDDFSMLEVSFP